MLHDCGMPPVILAAPASTAASSVSLARCEYRSVDLPKTAAQKARAAAEVQAKRMVQQNPTRRHLADRFEELVTAYNANSMDVERFFEELKKLIADMDEEGRRAAREEISEEELTIFDLLTKPEPKLTRAQEQSVKAVARQLHAKLRELVQVRDWQRAPQPRAEVKSAIRFGLDQLPQEPYPESLWREKVETVWQHIFSSYPSPPTDFRAAA